MSRIFEQSEHTYTKTHYTMTPYEKEITETITKVVGRKCDTCNHIFKKDEYYFELNINDDTKDSSDGFDIVPNVTDSCIKCIEDEFKVLILNDEYQSLNIYKCKNEL